MKIPGVDAAISASVTLTKCQGHCSNGDADAIRRTQETIVFMLQHLDQPLPVAQLAALARVSPSHYFALFKRWTGHAPIAFFIRLRLRRACRLLETTSLSVKEVAAALGYEDPFYFSRIFKSVNHVAPSEYRSLPGHLKDRIRSAVLPRVALEVLDHPGAPNTANGWRGFADAEQPKVTSVASRISQRTVNAGRNGCIVRLRYDIVGCAQEKFSHAQ